MDGKKDQSYFLWRLGQDVLSRCIFPLGALRKEDVRGYLARKGFEMKARGGESMEVCFIDKDYREFLREQVPDWIARGRRQVCRRTGARDRYTLRFSVFHGGAA